MKRRNPEHAKRDFKRCYGSEARVQAIKAIPCVVHWLCYGPTENAHVPSKSGMGRKGDARHVVPMCRYHHALLHQRGPETFSALYAIDLDAEAARIEALWPTSGRDQDLAPVDHDPIPVVLADSGIAMLVHDEHAVAEDADPQPRERTIE